MSLLLAIALSACGDPLQSRSKDGGAEQSFVLYNLRPEPVRLFWNDTLGGRQLKGELPTGEAVRHLSRTGHVFVFTTEKAGCIGSIEVRAGVAALAITEAGLKPADAATLKTFESVRRSAYVVRELQGYRFHVSKNVLAHAAEADALLELLVRRSNEAKALLPERYRPVLDAVDVWVEWERRDTSEFRYQIAKEPDSIENPLKWGGIEVTTTPGALRLLRSEQPWVMLHEYVHAIHDHLPQGAQRERIRTAWEHARALARNPGAYSLKNDGEFLSTRAEAWLAVGTDGESPRTAEELRELEPRSPPLLEELFGPAPATEVLRLQPCRDAPPRSPPAATARTVDRWLNRSPRPVTLRWVDPAGALLYPAQLAPDAGVRFGSREGSVTLVTAADGGCVGLHTSKSTRADVVVE